MRNEKLESGLCINMTGNWAIEIGKGNRKGKSERETGKGNRKGKSERRTNKTDQVERGKG